MAAGITHPIALAGHHMGLVSVLLGVVKLLLNVVVTIILLLQMEAISYVGVAAETDLSGAEVGSARRSLVIHAGGGLLALLLPVALSLYKPRGLTRYGWRKRHGP